MHRNRLIILVAMDILLMAELVLAIHYGRQHMTEIAYAFMKVFVPAALVTVVGVLVEVPVMLSLVALANRWRY